VPERRLKVTHFSPLSGREDVPENYHTLVYELEERHPEMALLTLGQDNNPSREAAEHSRANWGQMLGGPERFVEHGEPDEDRPGARFSACDR